MRLPLTLALLALAAPAFAQTPTRLHGTIATVLPGSLTITVDDGGSQMVLLTPATRYGTQVDRTLADIRPGEFIGSAALRGRDGRLHAQEVHIFPDSMRGTGEGHRAMDQPEQTMTNANVAGIASAPGSDDYPEAANRRVLTLRYPGGEQMIDVAPDIRVVGLVPGDASLLRPGAAVTIRATTAPGGLITAAAIQVEKDGVKPLP